MDSTFPLSNWSSTCREGGQLCVIILSNRVVQQYRACVVDLLGLGIYMCDVMCITLLCVQPIPILSASFYAIPISHFVIQRIFHLLVPSLFMLSNGSRGYSVY